MGWGKAGKGRIQEIADLQWQLHYLNTEVSQYQGKGKGKGTQGGGWIKGKGKGGKGDRPKQHFATAETLCKCCGKYGHFKSDCRNREKACSVCGKTGHLGAVCRHAPAADDAPTAPTAKAAVTPGVTYLQAAASKDEFAEPPWTCEKCYSICFDQKLKACPKPNCKAAKLCKKTEIVAEEKQEKSLIGKDVRKMLGEDASQDSAADEKNEELDKAEKQLKQAKEWGFEELAEILEEKVTKLKSQPQPSAKDATQEAKDVKVVSSERHRSTKIHEDKMTALGLTISKAQEQSLKRSKQNKKQ